MRSTSAQPALGGVVIVPKVGESGSRSRGPKEPIPRARSRSPDPDVERKKAIARSMVSPGVVVGIRQRALISQGEEPTAHTNLVPPEIGRASCRERG